MVTKRLVRVEFESVQDRWTIAPAREPPLYGDMAGSYVDDRGDG
jgi:hypothetical protein